MNDPVFAVFQDQNGKIVSMRVVDADWQTRFIDIKASLMIKYPNLTLLCLIKRYDYAR